MVNASDYLIDLPENTTSMKGLVTYTNDITSGLYGLGILLSVFAVAFLYMRRTSNAVDSLIGSMFVTSMTSYFLFVLGVVKGMIPMSLTIGLISLSTLSYLNREH